MRINIKIAENGVIKNVIVHQNEEQIIEIKGNRDVTVAKDQTKIIIES